MGIRHTQSFKIQAVEKALSRSSQTSLQEIADSLGVGYSTLGKWISKSRKHKLEYVDPMMKTKEKRPADWRLEERLNMVIACASLDATREATYDEVKTLRSEATILKETLAELLIENRLLKKSVLGNESPLQSFLSHKL